MESTALRSKVLELDIAQKELTGKTPARLFRETGIPTEHMFPDEGRILYVGDPWQRMGIELDETHGNKLTLIDYEFGDTASFITDRPTFLAQSELQGKNLLERIDRLLAGDEVSNNPIGMHWLKKLRERIEIAHEIDPKALDLIQYPSMSSMWGDIRKFIEEEYPYDSDDLTDVVKPYKKIRGIAWYSGLHGERGYKDLFDWETCIKPRVTELEESLVMLPEHERDRVVESYKRSWIDQIRLKKYTQKSHVSQALFPELPFANDTFKSLVASWSISVHLFPRLTEDELMICWQEIERVLDEGGNAYIFPMKFKEGFNPKIVTSLDQMSNQIDFSFIDAKGLPITNPELIESDAFTLQISKQHNS